MKATRIAFMAWLVIPWTLVFAIGCAVLKAKLPTLPKSIESAEVSACREVGPRRDTEICTRVEAGRGKRTGGVISGRTVWSP